MIGDMLAARVEATTPLGSSVTMLVCALLCLRQFSE